MNLCQPLFQRWSIIDGETVMSMSFKQFVSFQIFGKSNTVSQVASDAEAAYVVVIGGKTGGWVLSRGRVV